MRKNVLTVLGTDGQSSPIANKESYMNPVFNPQRKFGVELEVCIDENCRPEVYQV